MMGAYIYFTVRLDAVVDKGLKSHCRENDNFDILDYGISGAVEVFKFVN